MPLVTAQSIGNQVRQARKRLGVTQKQLAMTSGTGLRFVIDLEKGKPSCHLEKALAVLQTAGITLALVLPKENPSADQASKRRGSESKERDA